MILDNNLNRLGSINPRVGIRPVIDRKASGRETLEAETMNMANMVASFISSKLKYADGSEVQCVIPDSCISGVVESSQATEKFSREHVSLTITVASAWCYPTETVDMDSILPKAIWGFNGTERPGGVYLAAALATYNQKGIPVYGIYGKDVQDVRDDKIPEDVQQKLLLFVKSALAVATMRGTSYLSIGTTSMGITGGNPDENFFQKYLGMRNEYVDMTELLRRKEKGIYDKDEYLKALRWVKGNCREGIDYNPTSSQRTREQKNQDWKESIKMTLIAKDLMVGNPKLRAAGFYEEALGHKAIAAGFQGQRSWSDQLANGDFMEAILTSSFDWNGRRESFILATENDSLNAVTMLFGHLLTNTAPIFADVRTYWSTNSIERVTGERIQGKASGGVIHLINSGSASLDGSGEQILNNGPAMKPFWELTDEDIKACLDATTWYPAITSFTGNGGFSSSYVTKGEMPVTIARVNLLGGVGPVIQLAEGYTVELPKGIHDQLNERTNPTWPTTWFVPNLTDEPGFKDVYSVMNGWGSNHAAINYGHIGAELITLASLLRIPVSMHNVPNEKIFRPSAWDGFGINDPVGADFRACQAYGALYR